jgi:Tfp pilus assembly protein PilF
MPGHAAAARLLEDLEREGGPPEKPSSASRHTEAEALTADALRLFTANEHERAREAVARALDLDPSNRRARELHRILRVLG